MAESGEMREYRGNDGVPERLKRWTIETMRLDEPYVVVPEEYTGLDDAVWIDTSDPVNRALAIDKCENVKSLSPEHYEQDDLLIVMRVVVVDESGQLVEGLVADVRYCDVQFDEFDTKNRLMSLTIRKVYGMQ